jgi:serine/threonine protein phosphatase PrpC
MRPDTQDSSESGLEHGFAAHFFVPVSLPLHVEFGAASHVGLVRSSNEDHFAVFRRLRTQDVLLTNLAQDETPSSADEAYGFVVADGMGGTAAGETASRVAIQKAFDLADQASSWVMRLRSLAGQQMQERIDAYVTEMDRTLHAMGEADSDLAGMGTTWTSIYVVGSNAIIVQIGDSRAYLLRKGALKQITHDQTVAQALIDSGVPPKDTTRVRHILTNCLGGSQKVVSPNIGHLALQDGDRLLLCTDGLTDQVTDGEMADLLGQPSLPQAACDALVQLALDRGGKDNITVIVSEFARARGTSTA